MSDAKRKGADQAVRVTGRRGWASWATLTLMLLAAGGATAQMQSATPESYLRVEWTVEQSKSGRQRLTGYVYNPRDLYATGVRLLVEALDGSGQVVDSKTATVYGDVPPRNRSYFDTAPPANGSTYRVTVRTVDWRGYGAGGG
ncbi:MAG TPA: hypothetical protein VGT40_23800 [Methylomirabilota bacterium]|nr:hypothetical protein [Methylomirabilota bacterium]